MLVAAQVIGFHGVLSAEWQSNVCDFKLNSPIRTPRKASGLVDFDLLLSERADIG